MENPPIIYGNCSRKSNCYKVVTVGRHASLAKTKSLKEYENQFYIQCDRYRNADIADYFELHVRVFYPSQRSNLDNSPTGQSHSNDNKCVKIVAEKFLDKEKPRIEFELCRV